MSKKFVFSSTEDDILIEFVQQNREIFDSAHPKHKDLHHKETIWKTISEKVGRTGMYKNKIVLITNLINLICIN